MHEPCFWWMFIPFRSQSSSEEIWLQWEMLLQLQQRLLLSRARFLLSNNSVSKQGFVHSVKSENPFCRRPPAAPPMYYNEPSSAWVLILDFVIIFNDLLLKATPGGPAYSPQLPDALLPRDQLHLPPRDLHHHPAPPGAGTLPPAPRVSHDPAPGHSRGPGNAPRPRLSCDHASWPRLLPPGAGLPLSPVWPGPGSQGRALHPDGGQPHLGRDQHQLPRVQAAADW